jgi:LysM repeat protein
MFAKLITLAVALAALWALVPHTSNGAGREQVYVVRPSDTLWSIAGAHYAGDPREGVWKLERRNHLATGVIHVGERLVLPP